MSTPPARMGQTREPATGTRVVRGDMLAWSDDDPPAAAVHEVVARLVGSSHPQRVLLAGNRAVGAVDVLPEDTAVDVLVRGMPDARDATVTTGLHGRARVFCGGLDGLDADGSYDLVVALGGPQRLLGPDSEGLTDAGIVRLLAERVAEGGLLVTDIENNLGVHDLFATRPALDPDADEAWHVGAPGFGGRSLYRHEVAEVLADAGLTVRAVFAAYPDPRGYAVLVDTDGVDGVDGVDGSTAASAVRWSVARAITDHFSDRPCLRDPRDVAARVTEGRLTGQLAAAWLTVSVRAASEGPAGEQDEVPELPELPVVVAEERSRDPRWGRLVTVTRGGESRVRWLAGTDDEVTEDKLARDLAPLDVPTGVVLEDALRQACAVRSHREVRRLVTAYHAWLTDNSVWTTEVAERRLFATPSNVALAEDGALSIVDPSWRRVGIVSGGLCFVQGLREFSTRMLATASPHPWRSSLTPDELTTTLAAMAGVVVQPGDIRMVSRVVCEARAIRDGHQGDVGELIEADLEAGRWGRNLPSPTDVGFRELVVIDRGRARTQREQEGQIGWLEGTLRHRDRHIRELERAIESYEATLTYKAVQAMRAPRRKATEKAVESAKATAREVLPPDTMSKARRVAQRVMKSSG